MIRELLATSRFSLDRSLPEALPTLSITATTRVFAKAQIIKGIDMCRRLASSTSREFRRCPEGHRHWGRVKSEVLAELVTSLMPDEAVKALTSRGASVIREDPECKSAEAHHGPGLYLQVVVGTSPRTLYVGESDISVKVGQQGWASSYRQARDGKKKGAKILQARLDRQATSFAAVALLPLPADENWFESTHRKLHELSLQPRPAEEHAADLRNTLCSLLEAAFIAAMGTCQESDAYMARWTTLFGDGMLEIAGANVQDGIAGNFCSSRRVREGLTPRMRRCTCNEAPTSRQWERTSFTPA